MRYVIALSDIDLQDRAAAGDKAAFLGELIRMGLPTPSGYVVQAEAFRLSIAENNLDQKIRSRLENLDMDDPVDLETGAEEIRGWVEQAPMSSDVIAEIESALAAQWPLDSITRLYAVRVSRTYQDVPNARASGLEQAFLAVKGTTGVLDAVRKCWGTLWSSRAIYYRHRRKAAAPISVAVVVQPMIQAEAAGVLFTVNPLTGAADEIHIDATWGLGESIVAARWQPDHFVLGKRDRVMRERRIATKAVMERALPEGGWQMEAVPKELQEVPCLSDAHILRLADLAAKVEEHFHNPQDIEWCRVGEDITLLQTRSLAR